MNRRAVVLALAGLLAACAPKGTSLVTSWRAPALTPQQFQKVLVLFFAPHESQRQFGESELVRLMTEADLELARAEAEHRAGTLEA